MFGSATLNRVLRLWQLRALPRLRPRILRVIAHDPTVFTQGLCFVGDDLYESGGGWGVSSLRRLDVESGVAIESLSVEDDFAEDIAFHGGRLHQLTWTSGRLLHYSLRPLTLAGETRYFHEGWGLACHGDDLLVSDGSSLLRRYTPQLQLLSQGQVRSKGLPLRHLNAMEVVGNDLVVVLWCTPWIARIDLRNLQVRQVIDCTELLAIEAPSNVHHILNGIAYCKSRRSLFVTGKHWSRMFELSLEEWHPS